MKSDFRFLEVVFSKNCSKETELLEKLYSCMNDSEEVFLLDTYTNGAKFIINVDKAKKKEWNVLSYFTDAGFTVRSTNEMLDTHSLLVILDVKKVSVTFKKLDEERVNKMWN